MRADGSKPRTGIIQYATADRGGVSEDVGASDMYRPLTSSNSVIRVDNNLEDPAFSPIVTTVIMTTPFRERMPTGTIVTICNKVRPLSARGQNVSVLYDGAKGGVVSFVIAETVEKGVCCVAAAVSDVVELAWGHRTEKCTPGETYYVSMIGDSAGKPTTKNDNYEYTLADKFEAGVTPTGGVLFMFTVMHKHTHLRNAVVVMHSNRTLQI